MKKIVLILLSLLLVSCSKQATPEYVPEGAERDSIVADTDVFARNIQDGMEQNDFQLFSSNFDEGMKTALTEDGFQKIVTQYKSYFPSTSMELVNVQKVNEYFAVRYKVTYAKKIIIMRIVVNNQSPRQVSGLWFE